MFLKELLFPRIVTRSGGYIALKTDLDSYTLGYLINNDDDEMEERMKSE